MLIVAGDRVRVIKPKYRKWGIVISCCSDHEHETARWDFRLGDMGTIVGQKRGRVLVRPDPDCGFGEIAFDKNELENLNGQLRLF